MVSIAELTVRLQTVNATYRKKFSCQGLHSQGFVFYNSDWQGRLSTSAETLILALNETCWPQANTVKTKV